MWMPPTFAGALGSIARHLAASFATLAAELGAELGAEPLCNTCHLLAAVCDRLRGCAAHAIALAASPSRLLMELEKQTGCRALPPTSFLTQASVS